MSDSFLKFEPRSVPTKKTPEFTVKGFFTGETLGSIKWYPQWRRLCFFPTPGTVFDAICLKAISDEVTKRNAAYIAERAAKKAGLL